MAQNATTDGGNEAETYNLEVSKETVVNGLKINDRPGEQRKVVWNKRMDRGYGEGVLRDVRGLRWDGEAPPQLRPQQFVQDDVRPVESPAEARAEARRIAEEEGADPDQEVEVAMDVWEDFYSGQLKDEIVVEPVSPEGTKTVYNIEYVEE